MAETIETMIEARSLSKTFGMTRALKDLSFKIERGQVVGFLGPNGAGKTTTMRIVTGFLKPTAGVVKVGGIDVAVDPLQTRSRIGYLPENAPLYDEMMVLDFLQFIGELRHVPSGTLQPRLREICERCGLLKVLGKDIAHLSKGYRQRVGLAQAMIHDPDILILDEPTSGLDPNQIVEIRELIKDIGREKTVVLSTHILPEVQATCDRVIIISDGTLVADDKPDSLVKREKGAVIGVVVKAKNGTPLDSTKVEGVFGGIEGIRQVDSSQGEGEGTLGFQLHTAGEADPRENLFKAAVDNDLILLDMHLEHVSLEDTFRRLTRGEGGPNA